LKSKVLMVSVLFPPSFGGASVQSIRLAKELIRQGEQVEFITDNGKGQTMKNEIHDGLTVTRLSTYSDNLLSKLRELIFSIKLVMFVAGRPDIKIVHFHAIRGMELLAFPFLRLLGKKVILKLTLVGVDDPLAFKSRKLLSPFFMFGLKAAHAMVAISKELKERAGLAGFGDNIVKIIYNGFDETHFHVAQPELKQSLRKKFDIPDQVPVFLSIGKVEHRKGYDLVLQSFVHIQKQLPHAHLLIVGPDDNERNTYYVELQEFIQRNKLKNVRFAGRQQNVYEYTQAADFFLFCSRQEGFGTVLIEAMACGVPTVAMNIKGVTEDIITDPRLGVINYSHNPAEFAAQAIELALSVNQADVREAVALLGEKFSISNIAKSYIDLYHKL
jgi:L-malate glycosyltransferase